MNNNVRIPKRKVITETIYAPFTYPTQTNL